MAKSRPKSPSKGNIFWMLESNGLSGGVRVIFEMANGMLRAGWNVSVLSLNQRPEWFNTSQLKWEQFDNYNEMIARMKRLNAEDRVIATWWKTAFVLNESKHPSAYYLVQDDESNYYSASYMKDEVSKTYEYGLKMFTTSKWVYKNVFGTHYVGIGIRAENFQSRGNTKRQVFAIGRRQHIKGFRYLSELSQRLPLELSMPLVIATIDKSLAVGANTNIRFGLTDTGMAKEFAFSRYFANCSQHEGFCLPNLEAMASGCVVVTTNSDGVTDYAVDGENCLIVDRDDPREMVAAFSRLETDIELRRRLVEGGKETVKQWGWQPVFKRLDEFIT